MAIDFEADRLTLQQTAKLVGVHLATIWRWALRGVRGKRLRTIRIGARRWVLRRDLDAFLLQGDQDVDWMRPPAGSCKHVEQQLDEIGIRGDA